MAEQKRVAYFDYVVKNGDDIVALTSNKRYEVFNENEDTFYIDDDEGTRQYCLKGAKDCNHLAYLATWLLEDVK